MEGTFEFNNQYVALNKLEVSNIGNMTIEAHNEDDYYYYLIVRTKYGKTSIITYGPVILDIKDIINSYTVNVTKLDYNEKKIFKLINNFLNNPKIKLVSAEQVDTNLALNELKDIQTYIEEFD